jgi:hypothetical protein
MNWPTATSGQLKKKAGPAIPSPSAYSVKMPVDGEMYENATAKLE